MTLDWSRTSVNPDLDTRTFRAALNHYRFLNPEKSSTDFRDLPREVQTGILSDANLRKEREK